MSTAHLTLADLLVLPWKQVESTNLGAIAWEPYRDARGVKLYTDVGDGDLYVLFRGSGSVYMYREVERQVADIIRQLGELMDGSPGKFFSEYVIDRYETAKVEWQT